MLVITCAIRYYFLVVLVWPTPADGGVFTVCTSARGFPRDDGKVVLFCSLFARFRLPKLSRLKLCTYLDQPDRNPTDMRELLDGRGRTRFDRRALAAALAQDGPLRSVPQQLQQQESCLSERGRRDTERTGGGVSRAGLSSKRMLEHLNGYSA